MSQKLLYNENALARIASQLKEEKTCLERDILKLHLLLDEMNEIWKGSAQKIFKIDFASDISSMNNALEVIQTTVDNVNYSLSIYSQCEQKAYEAVHAIK